MVTHTKPSSALPAILLTIGISLVLGLLADLLFFEKTPGINFPLFIGLSVAGLYILAAHFKRQLTAQVRWLLVPLAFFSIMVFVRASVLLTLLNVFACLLLVVLMAALTSVNAHKRLIDFIPLDFARILLVPFKFIQAFFEFLGHAPTLWNARKEWQVGERIMKAVLISIPLLILFGLLFASADLVFQNYLSDLLSLPVSPEIISHGLFIILVTAAYLGGFAYIFLPLKPSGVAPYTGKPPLFRTLETGIVLGLVNVLFLSFILLQLAYLFGGEHTVSVQGFTYAEYARRGFFELIAVAVCSLLLLLITEKYVERKTAEHSSLFKGLSGALAIQVVIIMASAFKRLLLYEETYGFTTLRLYSHAFIILLAVIFVILLYKIFWDSRERTFAFRTFLAVLGFLVAMNILNPDAFIASRNAKRFEATNKLDVQYLTSLSDDAVPQMFTLLNPEKGDQAKQRQLVQVLKHRIKEQETKPSPWQSFNLSRHHAQNISQAERSRFKLYPDSTLQTQPQTRLQE